MTFTSLPLITYIASRFFLFNVPSKQSLISDFECCAGSSPFCLGMVDFDRCGVKHKFDNQHVTSSATSTNPFSFQMPTFSPVINSNSQGTINFTINICPSGPLEIRKKPLMTF